jgi:hypothetical protein
MDDLLRWTQQQRDRPVKGSLSLVLSDGGRKMVFSAEEPGPAQTDLHLSLEEDGLPALVIALVDMEDGGDVFGTLTARLRPGLRAGADVEVRFVLDEGRFLTAQVSDAEWLSEAEIVWDSTDT